MKNLIRKKGHLKQVSRNSSYDKIVKEKALKTGFQKQLKGKCRVCGKIGHKGTDRWTLDSTKRNNLLDTMTKTMVIEIISSTAIVTIATKRAIKKLIAGQNSGTMQQCGRGICTCDNT